MRIETNQIGVFVLKEVYNPIQLRTNSGEFINICMRDSGFEITYQYNNYEAQNGEIKKIV